MAINLANHMKGVKIMPEVPSGTGNGFGETYVDPSDTGTGVGDTNHVGE